ncbi:MAG: hypothetical protein L3J63_02495 [Geopsychrobacter sp.]|nr:hypothetical protein [Geopsychrobacter sp.]
MIKTFCSVLITLGMLLVLAQSAAALEKNLSWDKSPSPDVAGYKIYYKSVSPTLPFDGTGVSKDTSSIKVDSPINVDNNLFASLTLPDDGQVYYFAVTAYDAAGYESSYSNIVASGWIPPLLAPENGSAAEQVSQVQFDWADPPTSSNSYTYTLYYGTNSQLTAVSPPSLPQAPFSDLQIVLLLGLLLLSGVALTRSEQPKRILAAGVATLVLSLSLVGCGGGGGAGTVGSGTPIPTSTTVVVQTGTLSDYYANDLQPATTYYWKVVATDQTGSQYQSLPYKFTTTAN